MFLPEGDTCAIFSFIQGYTTAALVFPQRIPQHRYWLHRTFIVDILRFDRHNSIVVVNVFVRIFLAHRFILSLHLLIAIQNDVQKDGLFRCHLTLVKPATQNGKFVFAPTLICTLLEMLIFGGNFGSWRMDVREILNEQMFAKRGVPVFKTALIFDLQVKFVDFVSELVHWHWNKHASCFCRIKLFETKGVHNNLFGHFRNHLWSYQITVFDS